MKEEENLKPGEIPIEDADHIGAGYYDQQTAQNEAKKYSEFYRQEQTDKPGSQDGSKSPNEYDPDDFSFPMAGFADPEAAQEEAQKHPEFYRPEQIDTLKKSGRR